VTAVNLLSLSMSLPVLEISYKRKSLMPGFFHLAQCLKVQSCCSICQYLFLLIMEKYSISRVYSTFCLSVHQLMGIWIVSSLWLLWIVLLWTFICKFLFELLFSMILCIHSGMKVVTPMIILSLAYCRATKLFCTVSAQFYTPVAM
jgi:hypothetical protein